jgi:hypothetical protein
VNLELVALDKVEAALEGSDGFIIGESTRPEQQQVACALHERTAMRLCCSLELLLNYSHLHCLLSCCCRIRLQLQLEKLR